MFEYHFHYLKLNQISLQLIVSVVSLPHTVKPRPEAHNGHDPF